MLKRSHLTPALVLALFMVLFFTPSTYAQDIVSEPNDAMMACHSPGAYLPFNVGSKVVGSGYANCPGGGYHTFEVCIKRDLTGLPDPWSCNSYNDVFEFKSLQSPQDCFGNGNYYTEVTLDGNKVQSGRVSLNCS
jgi:hypothetical protein